MSNTFGRYEILGELGHGAMGAVYRARDPLIEREVAIKTLLPTLPEEVMAEVRERFVREARSAGRLNHPNIVTIFDVGQQDGVAYIAMELLEGRSLQQMLRDPDRLPFDTTAELVAQVAEALDHAHRFAIVHRDVKPANVMVGPSGRAKLTDFGVAYVASSTMTQTGAAVGSPRYMSPEQVLGQKVDARSDVFSLGAMLYEMLARRAPFDRAGEQNVFHLMNRIAGEPHPPLRETDAEIPAAFARIVDRALAKKPEERYQRAAEMASELRNWRGLGTGERSTVVLPRAPAEEKRARDTLLDDLDAFSKNFDLDAQEQAKKVEDERKKKEEELRRVSAAAKAARPAPAAASEPARRPGALDMLRKQSTTMPPREDPAVTRERAIAQLDVDLRAANRFFQEFATEVNGVRPASGAPYQFLYLGTLPQVHLSDVWTDSRPRRVANRDCCDYVLLRYKVNPDTPVKVMLMRDEIRAFDADLKAMKASYDFLATAKNDFGQPSRAVFTIKAGLACEVLLQPDYDALAVDIELTNVRRAGKLRCRVAAAAFKDVADELARYMLGADDDFERERRPAK